MNIFRGNNNERKEKLQDEINQLIGDYDKETAEYDKLHDTIETLQEEYDRSKQEAFHRRYGVLKNLIKKNVRKIRQMDRQAMMMSKNGQQSQIGGVVSKLLMQCQEYAETSKMQSTEKVLRDYTNKSTSELTHERNRLLKEIALYRERNGKIKDLFFNLDHQYQESKGDMIPKRYEEMKTMIKVVIKNSHV